MNIFNLFKKKDNEPDWKVIIDGREVFGSEKTKALNLTGRCGMSLKNSTINGKYYKSLIVSRR